MTRHRALHVMRMSGVAGAENHLLELVREMRGAGWDSDVLIPSPAPEALEAYAGRLQGGGTTWVRRQVRGLDWSLVRRIREHMAGGRYDVVHAHLIHAQVHVALAAGGRRGGRPRLVSSTHGFAGVPGYLEPAERVLMRRFDATIAITGAVAELNRGRLGLDSRVIYYGLEADPSVTRHRGPGTGELLVLSRLHDWKAVDVIVRAMPAVLSEFPQARLRIAGDGPERASLEALRDELGLGDRVEFLGFRTDARALLAQSDLLVHASRAEAFGIIFLEAMREHVPVVATRAAGIPEVVAHGETGLLVPIDDSGAMAAAIRDLLADRARRERMAAAGARRLREVFEPARMARETAEVYGAA